MAQMHCVRNTPGICKAYDADECVLKILKENRRPYHTCNRVTSAKQFCKNVRSNAPADTYQMVISLFP
jgi:hypothetical protein